MNHRASDILIVTALTVEREAIRAYLGDVRVERRGRTTADLGRFEVEGRDAYNVAVIETGSGNIDASVATSQALHDLSPGLVMMVGVAGGVKDVKIGDVVASRKVLWTEAGKAAKGGPSNDESVYLPRPDFAPVSPSLVNLARAVVADKSWLARAEARGAGLRLDGDPAQAVVAPIAIGENVIADSAGPHGERLRQTYGEAVAVAMEDVGVLKSVAAAESISAIAVRGISDLLDGKSAADARGSHALASANAAAFAFELLSLRSRLQPLERTYDEGATELLEVAARLLPGGPTERAVWDRAGGDVSRLPLVDGGGRDRWRAALRELSLGGGGSEISMLSLVDVMIEDFPRSEELRKIRRVVRDATT